MDAEGFDRIAKAVGGGTDRRRLVAGLLGAGLAGLLGRPVAADDAPKPDGKKCNKDAQCASGHCCGAAPGGEHGVCQACCTDDDCPAGQSCDGGQCVDVGPCPAGWVELRNGDCAFPCNASQACVVASGNPDCQCYGLTEADPPAQFVCAIPGTEQCTFGEFTCPENQVCQAAEPTRCMTLCGPPTA